MKEDARTSGPLGGAIAYPGEALLELRCHLGAPRREAERGPRQAHRFLDLIESFGSDHQNVQSEFSKVKNGVLRISVLAG